LLFSMKFSSLLWATGVCRHPQGRGHYDCPHDLEHSTGDV
jgi:hypothetical protein